MPQTAPGLYRSAAFDREHDIARDLLADNPGNSRPVKHAIAACNGTLALYVGLKALGIGEGDEVIVPDFTFIASANSVVMAGAITISALCIS